MPPTTRVLVTGHHGYLGSVFAPYLASQGYDVVGLDVDYFRECMLGPPAADVPSVLEDIRDITEAELRGFDAVVHLAALSNDSVGNLNPTWTRDVNLGGSIRLAEMARAAGVRRFIFSSSCIMYGLSDAPSVNEASPLDPRTEYARSKAAAEQAIASLASDRFSPTFLRNGTVYGFSPRMRFDTVLNDLMGHAVTTRRVLLHGDGNQWRPVVHIDDLARAFAAVLAAPIDDVHNQVFNTGRGAVNIEIGHLADLVVAAVPRCRLKVQSLPSADKRSYKADFTKFSAAFPKVTFRSPDEGVRDLYETFVRLSLTRAQYSSPRYIRMKWLKRLIDAGVFDGSLRSPVLETPQ